MATNKKITTGIRMRNRSQKSNTWRKIRLGNTSRKRATRKKTGNKRYRKVLAT